MSIQPCWVKSDSALSGAIWAQSGPKKLHQTAIPAHGLKNRTVMDSTETILFLGPKQLFLIYSVFSCKCSTVVHLKFHCLQDCVTELRHEIYNLNIGIHWEQRTALASTVVKKKKQEINKINRSKCLSCWFKGEFVNHSPAPGDLRILLVFYQNPIWFISL